LHSAYCGPCGRTGRNDVDADADANDAGGQHDHHADDHAHGDLDADDGPDRYAGRDGDACSRRLRLV
jgi:hypothetical protein